MAVKHNEAKREYTSGAFTARGIIYVLPHLNNETRCPQCKGDAFGRNTPRRRPWPNKVALDTAEQ